MAIGYGGIFTVGTAGAGSTNVSTTGTVTGANPTLVCFVGWLDTVDDTASPPYVTACTYNAVSLTYAGRSRWNYGADNYLVVEAWYMNNPPTGSSYTLAATIDDDADVGGMWIIGTWATGANNGIGSTVGTGSGSTDNPTVTFTTGSSASLIFGATVPAGSNRDPYTPGTGTTEIADGDNGAQCSYFAGYESATGGSDTFDCTQSGVDQWVMIAIEVQEAAAAAGDSLASLYRRLKRERTSPLIRM